MRRSESLSIKDSQSPSSDPQIGQLRFSDFRVRKWDMGIEIENAGSMGGKSIQLMEPFF